MQRSFATRIDGGRCLAEALLSRSLAQPILVLGLPRGGVPVALEVARALHAALDVLVVRKIGAPQQEELACGAVASGDVAVWNDDILGSLGLARGDLAAVRIREYAEVVRREIAIRGEGTLPPSWRNSTVVLIDDGLATGATMRAAVEVVKRGKPRQIFVGVPVAPSDTCRELEEQGCHVVCPVIVPSGSFGSVGAWYDDFSQVSTEECRELLAGYWREWGRSESEAHPA